MTTSEHHRHADVLSDHQALSTTKNPRTEGAILSPAPPHKNEEPKLAVESGSCYRPKDGQGFLGEDAHFVILGGRGFGIADGVGGWSRRNIDAGDFSRELMDLCEELMENSSRFNPSGCSLDAVLQTALAETTFEGTSTACIGEVVGDSLRILNIGDSGVLVVRDGGVFFHSPVQQRYFNSPLQIGRATPADPLEMAQSFQVALLPGDVVVVATDGLFDNLFFKKIAALVTRLQREQGPAGSAEEIAAALADAAVAASYKTTGTTPYAKASKRVGRPYGGGKMDDVTVVVIKILADIRERRRRLVIDPGGGGLEEEDPYIV